MGNTTVALIGATGFIGRHLLEALVPLPVRALVYEYHPSWLNELAHVETVPGNVLVPESLEACLRGIEVAVNLTGQVGGRPEEYQAVNLKGTMNFAKACERQGVRRVIHASSALVYGDALGAAEDWPCRPITPYAAMKLSAEEILHGLLAPDTTVTCLRLSNVYGPGQVKGLLPYLIRCIRDRQRITIDADGAQVRDFVHVADVANAFMKALAMPDCTGAVNVGSGRATSVLSLVRLLEDALDLPATGQYCPEHSGGERRNTLNVARAASILGWTAAVGLEEGVSGLVESYRAGPRERVGV